MAGIAIDKKVGIIKMMLGSGLGKYSDKELINIVQNYSVFARVILTKKLKIVNSLKAI